VLGNDLRFNASDVALFGSSRNRIAVNNTSSSGGAGIELDGCPIVFGQPFFLDYQY
jgi:hypothetical protein